MKVYNYIIVLIIQIMVGAASRAQFSVDQFLAGAKSDISMVNYRWKSDFLSSNPYRTPWIQRTELRTRTNDFNFSPDEYRFRLGPTNPFEIAANKKYYQVEFDYMLSEYQAGLNRALEERYQLIIDLLEMYGLKDLRTNQLSILEKEINYYVTIAGNPEFSVDDYIDALEDQIEVKMKLSAIQHDIDIIIKKIRHKHTFDGDVDPGVFDIISVKAIKNRLQTIHDVENERKNDLLVDNLHQELKVEEQRIQVEKAENRRNIGFIQAEFDRDRGNEFDEHLGFQLGVRLPLTNPDRPDLNRRRLQLIDDQADVQERESEITVQRDLIKLEMAFLLDQYDNFTEEEPRSKILEMSKDIYDHDPADVIKLNKTVLRIDRMMQEVKWQIYRTYIDYLFYTGQLIEPPLKNYLSSNVREIED